MEVENNLLSILNYEKFALISLFLKNRKAIYYCVKYHQTQNEKDKEVILEEMKQENIYIGKKARKQDQTLQSRKSQEEVVEEDFVVKAVKDDEISRINKKIIDLSLHDSEDRTGSKQEYKFKLPEGAEKI